MKRRYVFSRAHLEKMRDAGMGVTSIAKVYGCDQSTVRHWLKICGMPTRLAPKSITDADVDRAIASRGQKR